MGQRRNRGEGKDLGGKDMASRLGSMSLKQLMTVKVKKRPESFGSQMSSRIERGEPAFPVEDRKPLMKKIPPYKHKKYEYKQPITPKRFKDPSKTHYRT